MLLATIVLWRPDADLVRCCRQLTLSGAQAVQPLPLVHGAACRLDAAVWQALRADPLVRQVLPDPVLRLNRSATGPAVRPATTRRQVLPWGVKRIGAPVAWAQSKGKGVRVAVVDTGIDLNHPNLLPNLRGGINLVRPGRPPSDDNGHGTHVAGTVGAADTGRGVIGVAPEAHIYAVKAFDRAGAAPASRIIGAIQWCLDHSMKVINLSFGSDEDNAALREAVALALRRGVILVAAAGNQRRAGVDVPARYDDVLAATATTRADRIVGYAARGPEIDLAAPGYDTLSTGRGDTYHRLAGTSMAVPHVAGTAALIFGRHPDWSADEVMAHLAATAERLPQVERQAQGAGLVRADWAMREG